MIIRQITADRMGRIMEPYCQGKPTVSGHTDGRVAAVILDLCTKRGPDKTICPSEAARVLTENGGDWRAHMDNVRRIGAELMHAGRIEITQRGKPIDPSAAKGPIRFRLAPAHR